MILKRSKLVDIFSICGIIKPTKVMDVTKYIKFELIDEPRKLLISSTDFNTFLTIDYGDYQQGLASNIKGSFLLEYRKISAILKSSTTEEVEFNETDQHIVVRTNGEYKFSKYADIEKFPIYDFSNEKIGNWPVPVIKSAWDKVAVAVSQNVTKLSYQGVCYDGNFAATDSRRLAISIGENYNKDQSVILPISFGHILKHCKNEISVGLSPKGLFVIECPETKLIAAVRLLDAEFNDYMRLYNDKGACKTIHVDKDELISCLSRLIVFTDEAFKVIKLSIINKDGDLSLCVDIDNVSGGNELIEIIDHNLEGDQGILLSFEYHVDNLLDGVSSIDGDQVSLSFQDDGRLWIDEDNYHYLLSVISR